MKKSSLFALVLSVCAVSSFAQGSPESAGAKRIAERDAAYAKDHPAVVYEREALKKHSGKHPSRVHHHHVKHKAVR